MESEPTLASRLEDLEARMAFQDKTIDDLSDVVASQQQEIEQLKDKVRDLIVQLGNAVSDKGSERPPHY